MKDHAQSLVIQREHFDFLIRHCSACAHLSSSDKDTVNIIQAAVCPKRRIVERSGAIQKHPNKVDDFRRCLDQWRSNQLAIVKDRENYRTVIHALTQASTIIDGRHNVETVTGKSLNEIGKNLANLVARSLKNHMSQKAFSHFQSLLCLSYCVYLTEKGYSQENVENILEIVTPIEKKRRRLLVQASHVNTVINELSKIEGWNVCRATELFLICPLSIRDLLNFKSEDFDQILSSVSTPNPNFSGCLEPCYSMPGLIERLLHESGVVKTDPIETIARCLGYDPNPVFESSDPVDRVHVPEPALASSLEIILEQPDPQSGSRVSGDKVTIVTSNSRETSRTALQQIPLSRSILGTTQKDISASDVQRRKRPRLESRLIESHSFENHFASQSTEPQAVSLEFPPHYFGKASNSFTIPRPDAQFEIVVSHDFEHPPPDDVRDNALSLQSRCGNEKTEEFVPFTVLAAVFTRKVQYHSNFLSIPPQLSITRAVPDNAQSIWFSITSNIEGLKYLFGKGSASPKDVSNTRGYSLMRWALYGGMDNYKTVKFLVDNGADVDEESYKHIWDYVYREKCSPIELDQLRCVAMNPPRSYHHMHWFYEQQFLDIHLIVLGRYSKSLDTEIQDNPNAVHLKDAMNRTALDWATALAKIPEMKTLIENRSRLDSMDVEGRTIVLHAVDTHNDDVLRIVLEAGVDPNPILPEGRFRSSPLTSATFGGLVGMVKLLVEHGARVDACNPEGRTALHTAASGNYVECAQILLDYGADSGCANGEGYSPFFTAVVYNNHAMLKLFIDRCDRSCLEGQESLSTIAKFADTETMLILAMPGLLETPNKDDFAAAYIMLQSRIDYGEELENGFKSLYSWPHVNSKPWY